ncbi:HD domain-containing protein, partial [Corynebacterium sp. CCM 8862]
LPVPGPVWKKMRGIAALPAPWPKRATEDFLAVLSNPATLQPLVAAMDANGLWENFVPEWPVVRGLVPREPSHTHTVDTHLVHTVANCGRHTVQVARPDLLLLAALFHDMGKGTVRPHSQVGAEIAARAGARMGLVLTDRAIVQNLVAEHTTLMRLAVTCAPDDPRAVDRLVEACHWDPLIIDLLFELTRADGLATGPRVWTRPVEQAARSLVAGAKAHLSPAIPSRPYVWLPPGGTLRIVSRDPGCEMTLRAVTAEEIARLVSLIGAKGWLITDYRMVQAADRQPGIYNAVVGVRTTSPGAVDEKLIVEAHKSGVFTRLPEVAPAPTVVHWYTPSIGEVRTADRKGVLGQLLKLLPVVHWSSATTPGSTVIARFQLPGSSSGPAVEKSLMAALAGT